jgi:pantothenate kinase
MQGCRCRATPRHQTQRRRRSQILEIQEIQIQEIQEIQIQEIQEIQIQILEIQEIQIQEIQEIQIQEIRLRKPRRGDSQRRRIFNAHDIGSGYAITAAQHLRLGARRHCPLEAAS